MALFMSPSTRSVVAIGTRDYAEESSYTLLQRCFMEQNATHLKLAAALQMLAAVEETKYYL